MKTILFAFFVATSLPAIAAERAIDEAVVVKAPIAKVWAAWTTSAGIKTFFAPDAKIEARVDGPFQVYMNPLAAPGAKGADDMVILALQPPTMLSFTWNAPPHLAEVRKQRTYVTVRLAPQGEGETLVTPVPRRLGHGSRVGPGLRVLHQGLAERAEEPAEELRRRPLRLDRLDGAAAEDAGEEVAGPKPRCSPQPASSVITSARTERPLSSRASCPRPSTPWPAPRRAPCRACRRSTGGRTPIRAPRRCGARCP